MNPLTVLIADENELFRDGLRLLLSNQSKNPLKIVAEAIDGRTLMHAFANFNPDLIVANINMQGTTALKVASQIKLQNPDTGIILLSQDSDYSKIDLVYAAGINSIIFNNDSKEELLQAIVAASAGDSYYSSSTSRYIFSQTSLKSAERKSPKKLELSQKETQIVKLISQEKPIKQIASELNLSIRTIEDYIRGIKQKTGTFSLVGITMWNVENKNV
jgi:DNA-binding NarL/FixJ family response regulator